MLLLSTLLALLASSAHSLSVVPQHSDIISNITASMSYSIANLLTKPACGWQRGTYYTGVMAAFRSTQNSTYSNLAIAEGTAYEWNTCAAPSTNGNNQAIGQTYVELVEESLEPMTILNNTKANLDIQVDRAQVSDWYWIDATFMALPTFMGLGSVTAEPKYQTKGYEMYQYTAYTLGLWSKEYSLFYRDATYFKKTEPNGKPIFWGRGNGWAMAALARALPYVQHNSTMTSEFTELLQAMAKSLASIQGSDGMWRAGLLDPEQYPQPETTGSAMITAALAAGINMKVLDDATYRPVVYKAWHGLSTISLQDGGLVGYCQPVGASPGPFASNSTSDFCVGQFNLAAEQVLRLIV